MSNKSSSKRPQHGKRRAITGGAFGRKYIRKGGKVRHGYDHIPQSKP